MTRRMTSMAPRRARPRRGAAGFTVIEILIALAITAFGFAAIFSMQVATIQSNVAARDLATGINLAERYASRLRAEGMISGSLARSAALARAPGQWHSFSEDPVDYNGLTADESTVQLQRFCVHYRLDNPGANDRSAFNGRVRVVWPNANTGVEALDAVCAGRGAENFEEQAGRFYTVTLPVLIRMGG